MEGGDKQTDNARGVRFILYLHRVCALRAAAGRVKMTEALFEGS